MRFTVFPIEGNDVRLVVENDIDSTQATWLEEHTRGDLKRLFRGGLTRGGYRIGLSNCADFVEGSRFVLEQDLDDIELDHALEIVLEDCVYDWPYFAAGERKHKEFMRLWRARS